MQMKVQVDRTKVYHKNPGTVHVMVRIDAPEVTEDERKPIDVVLVLDVSGSMTAQATEDLSGPTKLGLMKESARKFVDNLTAKDRVGIVVFSTEVRTLAPLGELTDAHRAVCIDAIGRIQAETSTDLLGGMHRGITLFSEARAKQGHTRRVLLFTDGHPTFGVTHHASIVASVQGSIPSSMSLSTFGYGLTNGGGYDPELLTSIAKACRGNFYHAEGPDGILKAFAAELGSLRSVAASNVRVHIRPGTGVEVSEVVNDLTWSPNEQGVVTVEMGNIYGGESQYVVAALTVPVRESVFPRDTLLCSIEASGLDVVAAAPFREERDAHFRYVSAKEAETTPDVEVEEQRLRLLAGRAIEEAYRKATSGNYGDAARGIHNVLVLLVPLNTALSRQLVGQLQKIKEDVENPERFAHSAGSVHAASQGISHLRRSGSAYTDDGYTSAAQDRTMMGMMDKGDPLAPKVANPSGITPAAVADPSDRPAGPPSGANIAPKSDPSRSKSQRGHTASRKW